MAAGEVTADGAARNTTAKNMAVFIDADNLNDPTALDHVLTSLRSMADRVLYKRAYGRTESLKGIEAVLWRHGVRPVANMIVNKVTTDSALVIDAVEVVCTHNIDAVANDRSLSALGPNLCCPNSSTTLGWFGNTKRVPSMARVRIPFQT